MWWCGNVYIIFIYLWPHAVFCFQPPENYNKAGLGITNTSLSIYPLKRSGCHNSFTKAQSFVQCTFPIDAMNPRQHLVKSAGFEGSRVLKGTAPSVGGSGSLQWISEILSFFFLKLVSALCLSRRAQPHQAFWNQSLIPLHSSRLRTAIKRWLRKSSISHNTLSG